MHLTRKKRADTDVSFDLTFQKKRECTPDNRNDFTPVRIALVDDKWHVAFGGSEFGVDLTEQEENFMSFLINFATKNTTDGVLSTGAIQGAVAALGKSVDFATGRSSTLDALSALSEKSAIRKLKHGQYLVPRNPESPESPKSNG